MDFRELEAQDGVRMYQLLPVEYKPQVVESVAGDEIRWRKPAGFFGSDLYAVETSEVRCGMGHEISWLCARVLSGSELRGYFESLVRDRNNEESMAVQFLQDYERFTPKLRRTCQSRFAAAREGNLVY